MSLSSRYDFIFLGAGCATLSIVMRMLKSEKFSEKKILLVDKEAKTKNDRTWCFWEKQDGFFESIVHKKYWDKIRRDKKLMAGNKKVEYAPTSN